MPSNMRDTNLGGGIIEHATGGVTAHGQKRVSRAAQFMPFAALTGYYELARQQERVVEPKHELTDEEAQALSQIMSNLKRGDRVSAIYYDTDAYVTITGIVVQVDMIFRKLQVVKTVIAFDDLLTLHVLNNSEETYNERD